MPRPSPPAPEDELDELPPLDGDTEEALEPDVEVDAPPLGDATGADPLDDATAEDDPIEPEDIPDEDGGPSWLNDAGDSPDLDLGDGPPLEFGDEAAGGADEDAPSLEAEDFGFDDAAERAALDSGDEGPLGPDEELREEDLPSLDAEDESEGDDATFWEGHLPADEPLGLPWAGKPWARVGAPLGLLQARAIACIPRGAVVAARADGGEPGVVRVDLEGTVEPIAVADLSTSAVTRFGAEGGRLAVVLGTGELFVGDAGGGSPFEAVAAGFPVADAVWAHDALWVRTASGALLVSVDRGRSFSCCPVPGVAAAVARGASAEVTALVTKDGRPRVALVRGRPDGTIEREAIDAPAVMSTPAVFAARGAAVAYAARAARLVRRGIDGRWASFAWEGKITALSFVDDAGTLLVATYSEVDESTALVRLDASGRPAIVGRLGPATEHPDSDGQALGLACDDSRGVVWVAGGFGVAAFAIASE